MTISTDTKEPIAADWMAALRDKDGDYRGYGSLTHLTMLVLMQDFARHYHKTMIASALAALKENRQ